MRARLGRYISVADEGLGDELQLDLQGTPFQLEVWNELLAIPPGKTHSYLDVAQAINRSMLSRMMPLAPSFAAFSRIDSSMSSSLDQPDSPDEWSRATSL